MDDRNKWRFNFQSVSNFYETAFFAVLGGFISGVVGLFIMNRQRKRDAKYAFLCAISELEVTLNEKLSPEFVEFYKNSQKILRDAIIRFRPFIKKETCTRLDMLWHEYRKIKQEDLDWPFEVKQIRDIEKSVNPEFNELKPSEILRNYFKKFRDVAE
jgi:hypothetical protein